MNLTNICTRLDIFSLPPVAPIFPFQTWSHHKRIHLTMLLKHYVHWCHMAGAATFEICWNAKSTDATVGVAKYEDKSLYFSFKLILLNIFYLLSSYHPTNVILLLDSFSHVAEMLSLLILRLELQSMKISHYILSSNLHY